MEIIFLREGYGTFGMGWVLFAGSIRSVNGGKGEGVSLILAPPTVGALVIFLVYVHKNIR